MCSNTAGEPGVAARFCTTATVGVVSPARRFPPRVNVATYAVTYVCWAEEEELQSPFESRAFFIVINEGS